MGKLKAFFKNTHVITTVAVLCAISVIWILLCLMFTYPAGFVSVCIVLVILALIGYFIYQMYMVILGLVEQYKEDRR